MSLLKLAFHEASEPKTISAMADCPTHHRVACPEIGLKQF
jgi:hypothetical protein